MAKLSQLWPTATVGPVRTSVPAAVTISYFDVTGDSPFTYTAANWGSAVVFTLVLWFKATVGTVYARLYDETALSPVAASTVSTGGAGYTRQESSAITMTDGHVYRLQLGADGAATGFIKAITTIKATC